MLQTKDQVQFSSKILACKSDRPRMSISPVTSYYIRQILYQNRTCIKFIVAPNAALEAHPMADINAVINSLYPDASEAWMVIQKLENLASMHQILKENRDMHTNNLNLVEKEICWLLGFRYIAQDVKAYSES